MGCTASQPTCRVENRPKELDKCAALSSDVRWAWLRGRTLFTFVELRTLLKLYQVATATSDDIAVVGSYEQQSDRELAGPFTAAPSFTTTEGDESLSGRDSIVGTMSKEQFLAACQRDETFRLSEVVGTFGPRLFDVLDKDGDGKLDFEDFIVGMSKLLKGPESEKLKLMYAAYDLSGVISSEQRKRRSGGSGKFSRRSKFLTMEDMAAVLTSASKDAYPTLLQFSTRTHGSRAGSPDSSQHKIDKVVDGEEKSAKGAESSGNGESIGDKESVDSVASYTSIEDPSEALHGALMELARRNAAMFAERAVSEFGQSQDGTLTPKEFEKWASTGPVMRCRLREFSLDVNVVPFQGVRMA